MESSSLEESHTTRDRVDLMFVLISTLPRSPRAVSSDPYQRTLNILNHLACTASVSGHCVFSVTTRNKRCKIAKIDNEGSSGSGVRLSYQLPNQLYSSSASHRWSTMARCRRSNAHDLIDPEQPIETKEVDKNRSLYETDNDAPREGMRMRFDMRGVGNNKNNNSLKFGAAATLSGCYVVLVHFGISVLR